METATVNSGIPQEELEDVQLFFIQPRIAWFIYPIQAFLGLEEISPHPIKLTNSEVFTKEALLFGENGVIIHQFWKQQQLNSANSDNLLELDTSVEEHWKAITDEDLFQTAKINLQNELAHIKIANSGDDVESFDELEADLEDVFQI